MRIRASKWGNSLAVRIPSGFVRDFRLQDGDTFTVSERDGAIMLVPGESLSGLLSGITPENIPSAVDWGKPVGRENLPAYE